MRSSRRASLGFVAMLVAAQGILVPAARAQEQWDDTAPPPPPPPDEESATEAVPGQAAPPARPPDLETFQRELSPYGRWVDTPEYGVVWVPAGVSSDWQPYSDGQWVDTSWGWSFDSPVPWGWAAFHYGRWGFGLGLGWYWVPGFVWSPAWVSWRYYPGYVCWSPFGPAGFAYGHHWHGWVVVPAGHFTRPIFGARVPWAHVGPIVRAANPIRSMPSARFGGGGGWRGAPARASPPAFRPSAPARPSGTFRRGSFAPPSASFRGGGFARPSRSFQGSARSFAPRARISSRPSGISRRR
jgi:hypothetical protein